MTGSVMMRGEGGRVAMVISINIVNIFSTLPWDRVVGMLAYHGLPDYLIAMIRDYFRHKKLIYQNRDV